MPPTNLRSDYRTNPVGIDESPRLSWELDQGAQSAYQIQTSPAPDFKTISIDTKQIRSDQSVGIQIPLTPASRQCVYWRVQTWNEQNQPSGFSQPAHVEFGLLSPSDWQAQWIGSTLVGAKLAAAPIPYLRKSFNLDSPIQSARLYVSALGIHETYLNGQRISNDEFLPGWTLYFNRVQYHAFDVTSLLQQGPNAIGAILGDGWYSGHVAMDGRQNYGLQPKYLAQLEVTDASGKSRRILSDPSWKTSTGPLIHSDLLMGESYDARHELPNWSTPSFNDQDWPPVKVFPSPNIPLVSPKGPPVRPIQELTPIAPPTNRHNRWLFDLGQNMVGKLRLKVTGPAGHTLTIRVAEILTPKGDPYYDNYRSAKSTLHYTLKGGAEEIYVPTFHFSGFRYVEISKFPGEPSKETITGIVLHSDTEPTGHFECSDPLLNQLQKNIVWGQKGNFLEVPTDCPQRDERLGWMGDAQVFVRTACFNMNVAPFFSKWLQDVADTQSQKGELPPFAPMLPTNDLIDGGPAWADAGVICPWTIYLYYNDKKILEKSWPMMTRFMAFLKESSQDNLRTFPGYKGFGGFGDWLATNAETPRDIIGTAFYAYSADLMSRAAHVLNKPEEAAHYQSLFQSIRKSFSDRFITPAGLIASDTQTAYVLALYFNLAPDNARPILLDTLVRNIESRQNHLSTGFVGTPYIMHVLSAANRDDVAYKLLLQKTWPSWLYPVTKGATTIWERWDGYTDDKGFQDPGMNSFNHYAYGAIGDWLYSRVAGLNVDPQNPAYKHAIIRPTPGGNLTHARASLKTPYGHLESAWSLQNNKIHLEVTIPPNSTATIHVPTPDPASITLNGKKPESPTPAALNVGPGKWTLQASYN